MRRGSRSKSIWSLTLPAVLLAAISLPLPVEAHAPGLALSGFGTAVIDGVMSPGEWDSAGTITFAAKVPASQGGGTTPATLFVMNDSTNLYLAVRIQRPSIDTSSIVFEFDNDHDGVREPGDDAVVLNGSPFGFGGLFDDFRTPCPGAPPDTVGCGLLDTAFGGTNDGVGAVGSDGVFTVYEQSRPLNSADDAHDFSLNLGGTVGFTLFVRLIVGPFPEGFGDTDFPTPCISCAELFGDILIASPVIRVTIDIKPGSLPNSVNPRSRGKIPVAILSRPGFDAPTQVDQGSLTFGQTGDEASLVFCNSSPEDVNGDGFFDLVCHFDTPKTAFLSSGDTQGVLKGRTMSGSPFSGTDSVRIVPPGAP